MNPLINFLSNHFERILAINIFLVIGIAVIFIALKIRSYAHLGVAEIGRKSLQSLLYHGLIWGEVVLLGLTSYIFVINLGEKQALDDTLPVFSTTEWVKEDMTIYFIAGNDLISIRPNGSQRQKVFEAQTLISSYHFSPDGRYILIVSENNLYQYDRFSKSADIVETIDVSSAAKEEKAKGLITGIEWSPKSDKYCYRIVKWSRYSSTEKWYVYAVHTREKRAVNAPARIIKTLVWDAAGDNLYYPTFKAMDTSVSGYPYEVTLFKVPLTTLEPKLILEFPFSQPELPPENLALRGIALFLPPTPLSFGRTEKRQLSWVSSRGTQIGIDASDHLYYRPYRWWQKRLYKIPRFSDPALRHQYRGGRLVIENPRWLPFGRYVIMDHTFWGVVILEPSTGKLGILTNDKGNTFGWYVET